MSVEYRIDTTRGVVFSTWHGKLTAEDLNDVARHLRSDPAFNPDYRQLVDLSNVTGVTASFDAMRHYASDPHGDPFSGKGRRALIAPHNLTFGMARMYEALREDKDQGGLRVFRTLQEGLQWLGLDSL